MNIVQCAISGRGSGLTVSMRNLDSAVKVRAQAGSQCYGLGYST